MTTATLSFPPTFEIIAAIAAYGITLIIIGIIDSIRYCICIQIKRMKKIGNFYLKNTRKKIADELTMEKKRVEKSFPCEPFCD